MPYSWLSGSRLQLLIIITQGAFKALRVRTHATEGIKPPRWSQGGEQLSLLVCIFRRAISVGPRPPLSLWCPPNPSVLAPSAHSSGCQSCVHVTLLNIEIFGSALEVIQTQSTTDQLATSTAWPAPVISVSVLSGCKRSGVSRHLPSG